MKHIKALKNMMKVTLLSTALCLGSMTSLVSAAALTPAETEAVERADEKAAENAATEEKEEITALYTASEFKCMGVLHYEGYRYTWYSERVLPGGGLVIPGRHTDENGYVCDEDDFIVVASRDLAKGTEVDTPFGKKGKVYDWCAIHGTLDIYTNW